jgi:hypothetical protein
LVTNAGVIQVGPVLAMETKDFADAIGTMYWGGCIRRWRPCPG